MSIQNADLKKRIIEIFHKNGVAHLNSCLTAVDIIEDIYQVKKPTDKFILSSGHAGLALYCVLEKHFREDIGMGYSGVDAERLFSENGVHPHKGELIDASTGSLGHGLGIAVGMAIARRHIDVYCLISDGECAEGSIWESLRIAEEQKLTNLKLYFNFNGLSAMGRLDTERLIVRLKSYYSGDTIIYNTNCLYIPFLSGVKGHYKILTDEEYGECINILT